MGICIYTLLNYFSINIYHTILRVFDNYSKTFFYSINCIVLTWQDLFTITIYKTIFVNLHNSRTLLEVLNNLILLL